MEIMWRAWMKENSGCTVKAFGALTKWAARVLIYVFGLLFHADGTVHSGWWLTLIVNNIINQILHRYAFFMWADENGIPSNEVTPFSNFANLVVLGDDSVTGVRYDLVAICNKYKCDCYSMLDYARIMSDTGLHVTLANKLPKLVDYQPPRFWVLLKRKFRYVNAEIGGQMEKIVVSRLDLTSIVRPLMVMDHVLTNPPFDHYRFSVDQLFKEMIAYSRARFDLAYQLLKSYDKSPFNGVADERTRVFKTSDEEYSLVLSWHLEPWVNGGMSKINRLRHRQQDDFLRLSELLSDDDRVPRYLTSYSCQNLDSQY
jgi:hypothetical protein